MGGAVTRQPRLLFHSRSRRGLGHAMRGGNLARAVRDAAPDAAVLLHLSASAAASACGDDLPWVADATTPAQWAGLIEAFQPTLLVCDTMLPSPAAVDGLDCAFVWRRTTDGRHGELAGDSRLARMRTIVVPHTPDEFGQRIPAALAPRTVFTGPIVRSPDDTGVARVRARYRLQPDDVVITSTVGGGGFADSAAWLMDVVWRAHRQLVGYLPRLRHIVVRGPLHGGPPPVPLARMTVVDSDPDLVHLFAASTLVVAEAGYNTATELHHAGVPSVLVPGERRLDDQCQRATHLAGLGVARMADRSSATDAVAAIVSLARDGEARSRMRAAAAANPIDVGNRRAALALLAVAR